MNGYIASGSLGQKKMCEIYNYDIKYNFYDE